MSQIDVNIPDWLLDRAKDLAERDGVSVEHFMSLAIAERVSALDTAEFIAERIPNVTREEFLEALRLVPSAPPLPGDELE